MDIEITRAAPRVPQPVPVVQENSNGTLAKTKEVAKWFWNHKLSLTSLVSSIGVLSYIVPLGALGLTPLFPVTAAVSAVALIILAGGLILFSYELSKEENIRRLEGFAKERSIKLKTFRDTLPTRENIEQVTTINELKNLLQPCSQNLSILYKKLEALHMSPIFSNMNSFKTMDFILKQRVLKLENAQPEDLHTYINQFTADIEYIQALIARA